MSDKYGNDDDEELTVMQRQRQHDLEIELHKQGLTEADLGDGVVPGAFIDESIYK
ncbi:hypothetical protein [Psychrobacter alimentarius]|uniref:hypothetical protein n=1 Tax=Psychrobacter alimentarius TaxID=261164 RepID=UPI003FD51A1B